MSTLKVGIVGLPNVGKSTLFNILTKKGIPAENYPFCTIDPNVGIVKVEDPRLESLEKIENPEEVIPAVVEFVDIAGLVKGAHKGEGLGNQFLSHIREVSIIVHVVRGFIDENVTHVSEKIDPISDIETIEYELILKDIETMEGMIEKQAKSARSDDKEKTWLELLENLKKHLEEERKAIDFDWVEDFAQKRRGLALLTDKKMIYLINTDSKLDFDLEKYLIGKSYVVSNLKVEEELFNLNEDERKGYRQELGLELTSLEKLVKLAYDKLGLITFFTVGPMEVRAWTTKKGATIREAAGVIHTDFGKNFIAADVVPYSDFTSSQGWEGAKKIGKVRLEGRDYIVQDGDIVIVKHGA